MHIVEILGRIFISSLFIVEAVRKFFSPDEGMMYMSDYGVPEILFYPSLIFEFVVPLILIAGFKTKFFASLLFLFVLSVTVIFHTDFNEGMQMMLFLKDIAIAGGFMIIIAFGPGKISLDHYFKSKQE